MIIFRYLAKEVLVTLLAVCGILLLITMSGRFIKYLAEAAAGELAADILFLIMGYRLPGFLELILPLSLFLGILLAYGRMYLDSEMTVLTACGYSLTQLLMATQILSLVVAVAVGCMSLWLSPWGARQVEKVLVEQESMTEFDMLAPGRFQPLSSGSRVTYTEGVSRDRQQLSNVFIAEWKERKDRDDLHILLVAEKGSQAVDEKSGNRFLLLDGGYRYEGSPGSLDFRVTRFKEYGVRISEPEVRKKARKKEAEPTGTLLESRAPGDVAEFQWRISLPLLVPVVTLMAIPLSRVNPRQGRFFKLFPAIMLYLLYVGLLIWARDGIEKGDIGAFPGVWGVHALFLLVGMALMYGEQVWLVYQFKKGERGIGA